LAREPFRFTLEPERIAVEAERDELRNQVARAEKLLAQARAALAARQRELLETRQRIRAFHDEELRSSGSVIDADAWRARSEFLEGLRARERAGVTAVSEAEAAVRTATHALQNLVRRLGETELRLKALEDEARRQLKAWRKAEEQRAEKKRDEDAQLRWTYENRRKNPEERP